MKKLILLFLFLAGAAFGADVYVPENHHGNKVYGLPTPAANDEAATKGYVDTNGGGGGGGISSVPVGNTLYVDTTNGNNLTAVPGFLSSPYKDLAAAVAAATAGQIVQIGPGTFTLSSPLIFPANNITLYGSGAGFTIITGAPIKPRTGCVIADLTVNNTTGSNASFSFCIGLDTGDTAATDVTISGVKLIGNTDGLYFNKAGVDRVNVYDSVITTTLEDVFVANMTGSISFNNCDLIADGSIGGASIAAGINQASGSTLFSNGTITTINNASANTSVNTTGSSTRAELHNVRINRTSPGFSLVQASGSTVSAENVSRTDGAALSTSGTITQLSRYAVRDLNLSDLASTSTGAINLLGTPTKGKLAVGDGSIWNVIGIGADGLVLTADSAQTLGLGWKATGNVSVNGTPTNGQLAKWFDATTISGTNGTPSLVGLGNVTNDLQIKDSNFPSSSVDSEIALFSGASGKSVKRATGSGIVTATSGVYGTEAAVTTGQGGLPTGGTINQVLAKNSSTNYDASWVTGGAGGTPGGATTNVQYNNSSAFGGDGNFTWDSTNHKLGVGATGVDGTIGTLAPAAITTAQPAGNVIVAGADGIAGTSVAGAAAGGSVTIQGGNAHRLTSGNGGGGSIILQLGTGIGTGTNGQFSITTAGGGNQRLSFTPTGLLSTGIGSTTPPTAFTAGDTSSTTPRGIMSWQASTDTSSANIHMRKNRGTFGSPTTVAANDVLGRLVYSGYEGTSYVESAYIRALVTGTVATTRVPSQLEFYTGTDAAPTVATKALTLDNAQNAQFAGKITSYGGAAPTNGQLLIGDTSNGDLELATLTAGSNVTITNAGHSITIASTGGGGSGTVTNTGGALTSNAIVLGAGGNDTAVSTGITTNGVAEIDLGVNATTAGKLKLFGSGTGSALLQTAAAAGTGTTVTMPNASSTLPIFGQQLTFSGPTAARTVTFPDANFTAARTDAANTFTGVQTMTSPAITTPTGIVSSDVGLGNVTNDAQTKALIVPNTAPSAGKILVGNAGGTAYAPVTLSGSGATLSLASTGVATISAIANASLSNSTITIGGTSTALGGTYGGTATGTGNIVLDTGPTLSNPVVGTQSAADNSTKAASTAYADRVGNTGGWTSKWVVTTDATTTGQSLTPITGLTTGTLAASTLYECEIVLFGTSSTNTGVEFGFHGDGTGTAATCALTGVSTASNANQAGVTTNCATIDTATAALWTVASGSTLCTTVYKGFFTTNSTGTLTVTLEFLKVTSGTATVKVGSVFRYRLAGQ